MLSKKIITYVSGSIQLNETEINKVILPQKFKMKTVSFFFSVWFNIFTNYTCSFNHNISVKVMLVFSINTYSYSCVSVRQSDLNSFRIWVGIKFNEQAWLWMGWDHAYLCSHMLCDF